jgi:hypothetical protein
MFMIYMSQHRFSELTLSRKYKILDNLYSLINTLPVTIISVGISKVRLIQTHPDWDVFNAAWTFLTERFDKYLSDHGNSANKGIIIVDKSSKMPEKSKMPYNSIKSCTCIGIHDIVYSCSL